MAWAVFFYRTSGRVAVGLIQAIRPHPQARIVNEKMSTKAKARTNIRAFDRSDRRNVPKAGGLFVLFGLLFRRREALKALEQFFLGHAFDRDLGVVGIDAGAGRADQR